MVDEPISVARITAVVPLSAQSPARVPRYLAGSCRSWGTRKARAGLAFCLCAIRHLGGLGRTGYLTTHSSDCGHPGTCSTSGSIRGARQRRPPGPDSPTHVPAWWEAAHPLISQHRPLLVWPPESLVPRPHNCGAAVLVWLLVCGSPSCTSTVCPSPPLPSQLHPPSPKLALRPPALLAAWAWMPPPVTTHHHHGFDFYSYSLFSSPSHHRPSLLISLSPLIASCSFPISTVAAPRDRQRQCHRHIPTTAPQTDSQPSPPRARPDVSSQKPSRPLPARPRRRIANRSAVGLDIAGLASLQTFGSTRAVTEQSLGA